MKFTFSLTADTLSPALEKRLATARNRTFMHEAIGNALVALTKRAFTESAVRPSAWAPLYGGSASTLYKSGTLAKSVRLISTTASAVQLGSDRKYAAIHQFGGIIRAKPGGYLKLPGGIYRKKVTIPARPYFPFYADGRPTPAAITAIHQAIDSQLGNRA
jgi:phage gpG-like protein